MAQTATMTFEKAKRELPACCMCAFESCDTGESRIKDLVDGCFHELDLYHEGEENLTPAEAKQVSAYLRKLGFPYRY